MSKDIESAEIIPRLLPSVKIYYQRFKTPEQRFWEKVDKTSSPCGCWVWVGSKGGKYECKYGHIYWSGTIQAAHRVSWLIHKGAIPSGLQVLHNCPGGDNTACVNPDHLWLGTHDDNMRDRDEKERNGATLHPELISHGERHYRAKLNEATVREIRARVESGESQASVAKKFSVLDTCIYKIVHRSTSNNYTVETRIVYAPNPLSLL